MNKIHGQTLLIQAENRKVKGFCKRIGGIMWQLFNLQISDVESYTMEGDETAEATVHFVSTDIEKQILINEIMVRFDCEYVSEKGLYVFK